jgi:hypothetical protein
VPLASAEWLKAKHDMKFDEKYKSKIPAIIEMQYEGRSNPITVIDFLQKYIMPNFAKQNNERD